MHRLVGPKMRWKQGLIWAGLAAGAALGMIWWQAQDPREWNVVGPKEGTKYFEPSLARTATGNFISAETLDMNDYCLKCHKGAHDDWAKSAHRFSSFNNPAYLASVAETREVSFKRDGNVQGSRFCAGLYDHDEPEAEAPHAGAISTARGASSAQHVGHLPPSISFAQFPGRLALRVEEVVKPLLTTSLIRLISHAPKEQPLLLLAPFGLHCPAHGRSSPHERDMDLMTPAAYDICLGAASSMPSLDLTCDVRHRAHYRRMGPPICCPHQWTIRDSCSCQLGNL
jgi:hypothetical protein